jgi:hypothetical protein
MRGLCSTYARLSYTPKVETNNNAGTGTRCIRRLLPLSALHSNRLHEEIADFLTPRHMHKSDLYLRHDRPRL